MYLDAIRHASMVDNCFRCHHWLNPLGVDWPRGPSLICLLAMWSGLIVEERVASLYPADGGHSPDGGPSPDGGTNQVERASSGE